MAQQQPHQLRAGVAGGAEYAYFRFGGRFSSHVSILVLQSIRTTGSGQPPRSVSRGKHAADPSPAARTISVARRFLGTAAATRNNGGNSHHGRRYSGSPRGAQGCLFDRRDGPHPGDHGIDLAVFPGLVIGDIVDHRRLEPASVLRGALGQSTLDLSIGPAPRPFSLWP